MSEALILSAFLLGLAGMPHCAAMCGAACTALTASPWARQQGQALAAFHLARMASYATVGAVLAWATSAMPALQSAAPMLRPFWVMLHMAVMVLAGWLLVTGRMPLWMGRLGLRPARGLAQTTGEAVVRIVPRAPWRRALAGGALWAGWPCGLLQTALLTAALSATPLGGGLAMAAFALASAPALWLWPWLWRRLGAQASVEVNRWAVRVAGLGLAVGSGFALWHGLWGENGLFC